MPSLVPRKNSSLVCDNSHVAAAALRLQVQGCLVVCEREPVSTPYVQGVIAYVDPRDFDPRMAQAEYGGARTIPLHVKFFDEVTQ